MLATGAVEATHSSFHDAPLTAVDTMVPFSYYGAPTVRNFVAIGLCEAVYCESVFRLVWSRPAYRIDAAAITAAEDRWEVVEEILSFPQAISVVEYSCVRWCV